MGDPGFLESRSARLESQPEVKGFGAALGMQDCFLVAPCSGHGYQCFKYLAAYARATQHLVDCHSADLRHAGLGLQ